MTRTSASSVYIARSCPWTHRCDVVRAPREWYSYHFPELVKIVSDNYMYAVVARFIKDRKQLTDEKEAGLEEILMDSAQAKAVIAASRTSMGTCCHNVVL